jgi:acylphosphatase
MEEAQTVRVKFEIFGHVQGVFFRANTQRTAHSLGLRGYVQNTTSNTVTGVIEGSPSQVEVMRNWLTNTGSLNSVIERAEFKNLKTEGKTPYVGFIVKK